MFYQPTTSTPLYLNPNGTNVERLVKAPFVLSDAASEEIDFAFSTLDMEKKGHITPRQAKVGLRGMGFPVKKQEVAEMLRISGSDPEGPVSHGTFRQMCIQKLSERSPEDDMRRAFQLFDMSGTGKIDAFALKRITKSLGLEVSDLELSEMITEFDSDRDGMINEQEFLSIMVATQD
jgi:Ca2+-binding EF-hand superfamily protein